MLDKGTEREILNLKVYCSNKDEVMCDWTGELRHLEDHLKSCSVYVSCQYECGYQCHVKRSEEMSQHEINECQLRPEIVLPKEISRLKERIADLGQECEEKKSEIEEYKELIESQKSDHVEEKNKLREEMNDLERKKKKEVGEYKAMVERQKKDHTQELTRVRNSFKKNILELERKCKEQEDELRECKMMLLPYKEDYEDESEPSSMEDKPKSLEEPISKTSNYFNCLTINCLFDIATCTSLRQSRSSPSLDQLRSGRGYQQLESNKNKLCHLFWPIPAIIHN